MDLKSRICAFADWPSSRRWTWFAYFVVLLAAGTWAGSVAARWIESMFAETVEFEISSRDGMLCHRIADLTFVFADVPFPCSFSSRFSQRFSNSSPVTCTIGIPMQSSWPVGPQRSGRRVKSCIEEHLKYQNVCTQDECRIDINDSISIVVSRLGRKVQIQEQSYTLGTGQRTVFIQSQ
jgi:hypothetical protein